MPNELEEKLHRTWVQFLVDHDYPEIAAIALDGEISVDESNWNPHCICISLPTSTYTSVTKN